MRNLFPRKAVVPVDRDWNGPNDNVWRTRKGAAELIPAVPQGLELSYRSETDGPFWLREWHSSTWSRIY